MPSPTHPTLPEIRLTDGEFYADDPTELYAWMRANAPVYWDEVAQAWGITRYDDVRAVSKDSTTFSNAGGIRPGYPALPMMIDMDDPQHWGRRKLVNRGFTPRRVRDQLPKIHEACNEIVINAANAFSAYQSYAADVIAKRRAEPTDDLMSILVHAAWR